jgi:hypothetical protein
MKGASPISYPPIYSFPPFFTRQRNQVQLLLSCQRILFYSVYLRLSLCFQTTEKQRKEDWVKWIITWTKAKRVTELLVEREVTTDLFNNKSIGRALSVADVIDVLQYMAERGNGEWIGQGNQRFLVLYRSYGTCVCFMLLV